MKNLSFEIETEESKSVIIKEEFISENTATVTKLFQHQYFLRIKNIELINRILQYCAVTRLNLFLTTLLKNFYFRCGDKNLTLRNGKMLSTIF